jgi:predicted transcriptional regulator
MKEIPRRDKMKIYGDLLFALKNEPRSEEVVLTHVQVQIGVPFDRFKNYLMELKELGLIEETSLELTEKGNQYLKEYQEILVFMKRMGLTYR